jgi:hypothetical protein
MHRARVVALDESLAIEAADLSLAHGFAMAGAVVYARRSDTRDARDRVADFEGLPNAV